MTTSRRASFMSTQFRNDVLAWCKHNDMTRRNLALAAGLDLSSMLGFLRGERDPSLLVACALADVCGFSLDYYRLEPVS